MGFLRAGAAALAAAACLVAHAGDDVAGAQPKASPGSWQPRVFRWYYNPANHPAWLSADEARDWVIQAASRWEVCGVRMEYMGETGREPLRMDHANVVGWRHGLPRKVRGVTGGRSGHGRLIERDIAFDPDREEFRRFPRLLRKVLVHEFGHAIGLTHSTSCTDVMTLAADCPRAHPSQLPLAPTAGDVERCKALYP